MQIVRKAIRLLAAAFLAAVPSLLLPAGSAAARGQIAIGVTETIDTFNPYADSTALTYGIWCQVYGCLGIYDFKKGDYVPMLAERWEVDKNDPNVWTFFLRKGMKRHGDGKELTAEDVVHTFNRVNTDPTARQRHNVAPVKEMIALDRHTVKIATRQPTAPLLEYLFDRFVISGKDLFDKHGAREVDRKAPLGWGPYRLKDLSIGQRLVLEKVKDHPDVRENNPDILIFNVMREAEQRVTALLNGEIQIAQFIPPHLTKRIEDSRDARVVPTSSIEIMFLAMSPKYKPWDDRLLRQAVCHAIDKDAIIKTVLRGKADRLDGPVGNGQYGYDPDYARQHLAVAYDPAKAKELIARSGYKGEEVVLDTPVGRYINDKQISEAIIPMLNAVGIKARLRTPEWATLWSDIQKGRAPFYYIGRGSMLDPSVGLSQFFETGKSPRIGISDPEIDRTLAAERRTFDPAERKKALNEAFKAIVEAAPACFLWREKKSYGEANSVEHDPVPFGRLFGTEIFVR